MANTPTPKEAPDDVGGLSERFELALEFMARNKNRDDDATQAALARACGVSSSAVSQWLSGKAESMNAVTLIRAADFLGVSPRWLATGSGDMLDTGLQTQDAKEQLQVMVKELFRHFQGLKDFHKGPLLAMLKEALHGNPDAQFQDFVVNMLLAGDYSAQIERRRQETKEDLRRSTEALARGRVMRRVRIGEPLGEPIVRGPVLR